MFDEQRLEQHIKDCREQWDRLSEHIRALRKQKDEETRFEEKIRLESLLSDKEKERQAVEDKLGELAQLSQLRHVETKNPLFFNGSSQKVCTTFARLFLQ
jgi:hypothetical protein